MNKLIKNIKVKHGTREGSRRWFAEEMWTIERISWNKAYPDVVTLTSHTGDFLLFVPWVTTTWRFVPELSNAFPGEALLQDLKELITDENVAKITYDDNLSLEIHTV